MQVFTKGNMVPTWGRDPNSEWIIKNGTRNKINSNNYNLVRNANNNLRSNFMKFIQSPYQLSEVGIYYFTLIEEKSWKWD